MGCLQNGLESRGPCLGSRCPQSYQHVISLLKQIVQNLGKANMTLTRMVPVFLRLSSRSHHSFNLQPGSGKWPLLLDIGLCPGLVQDLPHRELISSPDSPCGYFPCFRKQSLNKHHQQLAESPWGFPDSQTEGSSSKKGQVEGTEIFSTFKRSTAKLTPCSWRKGRDDRHPRGLERCRCEILTTPPFTSPIELMSMTNMC